MTTEITIDENNFDQYFRDINKFPPERGDVLAKYSAIAELVDGDLKQDIVKNLTSSDFGAKTSSQIMKKIGKTNEKESIRVVKEICKDLTDGMSEKDVLEKPYKYTFEMSFFTKKEYVPLDDLHWEIITINNLDDYMDVKETYTRDSEGRLVKKVVLSEKDLSEENKD